MISEEICFVILVNCRIATLRDLNRHTACYQVLLNIVYDYGAIALFIGNVSYGKNQLALMTHKDTNDRKTENLPS